MHVPIANKRVERTYISQFEHAGQSIDVLYTKGNLSYIFEVNGKRYGGAVKAQGRSIRDTMNATVCLIINYLETREALETKTKKHDSK